MRDIYLEPNYGKLYEKAENGVSIMWNFKGIEGEISHLFILREIPITIENSPWYDIITPYGYGGPVIQKINEGFSKEQLVFAFEKEFGKYCFDNKIVSEFVRFHPIANNGPDFKEIYNSSLDRHTIGTNLKENEDPFTVEYSKGSRKNIKQAINKGILWRVTPQPEHIEKFKEIYYSTMDRNNAGDYYYFKDEYFADCIKYFRKNLLFVEAVFEEKTIAAGLYFIYDKTIHIHLSGTLSEYLYLSPAYILRYASMLWGKENGYEIIHHGGGRTNAIDDSLYLFKKQFGKTEYDFYIGKKIWNTKVYEALCKESGNDKTNSFFPAYRSVR